MTRVLIMAGGRGLRLDPLTRHSPKPMLAVGGKPILATLINSLIEQGVRDITLAVCYKADLIQDYFGFGGVNHTISYIHETTPLGTGGALKRMARPTEPILIINADIITHFSIADLLDYHEELGAPATMCVTNYPLQVPFGVIQHEDWKVLHIDEKPIIDHLVGAGIYVLSPEAFDHFPQEDRFDMPDFLMSLPSCAAYLLPEFWLDVGTYESYERANGGGNG